MYLKELTALQIMCRNTLGNIKLKNYSEVTTFFDEFEKATNELKAAGAKVTKQEKLPYMIITLTHTYSYISDLIDVLPEDQRTVEFLKEKRKLKSIEEQNKDDKPDENPVKSNAFVTERKDGCYHCGKPSHKKRECFKLYPPAQQGYGASNRGNHKKGAEEDPVIEEIIVEIIEVPQTYHRLITINKVSHESKEILSSPRYTHQK